MDNANSRRRFFISRKRFQKMSARIVLNGFALIDMMECFLVVGIKYFPNQDCIDYGDCCGDD